MFAKRQPAFAGATGAPAARFSPRAVLRRAGGLIRNPYAAAAMAALLFLGAGAVLLLVAGDPRAGAPSVKVALNRPKVAAGPNAPAAGMEAFTIDTLGMYQDLAAPGFELTDSPPVQGTAVITLPDGAADGPGTPGLSAPTVRRAVAEPLAAAPLAGVVQAGGLGPMPVIAPDGRTPYSAYARPFKSDGRPKVALIVGGLGLNPAATKAAIERLPPEITLSFVPYSEGLQGWIDLARANGHEVMLEIPMEPADYPDNDPGPYTLLSSAQPQDTVKRLEWLMSRATGYFAVTNYLGQRFVGSDTGMNAFLGALKSRGVGFIDDGAARRRGGAWARATADAVVDDQLSADAIASQLASLEQTAKVKGSALGSGFAYPVTVEVAARWADSVKSRGLQLAPASAVSHR
jgi:polysaccharide deacetylase 2 family uncharacterized protein YibQ